MAEQDTTKAGQLPGPRSSHRADLIDQGPRLTPAQITKYRDRLRVAGDPAICIGRFLYHGRALNIQTGELQPAGINIMYQRCYWHWDQADLLEILADLRDQLPEGEKGRLRLYAGD